MKLLAFLFSVFFCICVSNAQKNPLENQKSHRIEKIINSHWTFNYFPNESAAKGCESPVFDDSRWPSISLPHTWSTYETTGELHHFLNNSAENDDTYWRFGWGWYRKHFSISRDYSDRKVFVEFEGVQEYCKVWLNGKYLGDHKGGYSSFDFDITGYLNPDEDNVLAIAVNNLQIKDLKIPSGAPGNLNASGGITRDVTLVLKDKLYIPMQGSASHEGGIFVTTPQVSGKEGVVRIQTWVKNDYTQKKNCTLQTSIVDANNKIVNVIKSEAAIDPGQLYKFDQKSKPVKNPHLWSNEDPYLYKVYTEIRTGNEVVDSYECPFGFRWFRWNDNENFIYVNNRKVVPHGGNYHTDCPWLGDAIPKWITMMDYRHMSKNLKYNFIRTLYHPNDKLVYKLADEYGIYIYEESSGAINRTFPNELMEQQMKEMIRRDRNHPSILFWGMGKETNDIFVPKFAVTEDTTRIMTASRVLGDSALAEPVYANIPPDLSAQSVITGEPAKIVVTGSHPKIVADRGSVTIIGADIVDSNGNHVYGLTKTIRWNVTGPATLVGPTFYDSEITNHRKTECAWYPDMSVTNVIRSTGKPGRIHVTVLASGVASGSFDIDAEAIKPDNSVIIEPELMDDGRKPVARITITVNRLEDVPQEIRMTDEEFNLGPSDKQGFASMIKDYILKNNPSLDSASLELKILVDLFASYLLNNNGHLVADDYNYNVDHYNNCRLISGYINSTKLPLLFKEGLRKYYAYSIIGQGNEKNAGDEMNWLNWIPSGGTVVIVQNENINTRLKGAIFTEYTGLSDIISVVYPQFVNFSEEAKERALIFISKMNPYVHATSTIKPAREGDKEKRAGITYTADKGQPILIPLLKFISE